MIDDDGDEIMILVALLLVLLSVTCKILWSLVLAVTYGLVRWMALHSAWTFGVGCWSLGTC